MRIAILHAAHGFRDWRQIYFLGLIARQWERWGHKVTDCFGPVAGVRADLLFVHTDLSVVPRACLAMARRYPASINGTLKDIRKSRISRLLIRRPDEAWDGPVIVKTDLNHGGVPERWAHGFRWASSRLPGWVRSMGRKLTCPPVADFPGGPTHYPVYHSLREVPVRYFRDRQYVVERFVPEREGSRYVLRHAYRLGSRYVAYRFTQEDPLVRSPKTYDAEIPFPEEIRHYLIVEGMEYAKIDYVEHGGRVYILDVNKTIGDPTGDDLAGFLAAGILDRAGGMREEG